MQGSLPSRPGSQVQPGSPVDPWLNRMLENWPQLVHVAMRTLGCRYLAEDAVQQSLLKICETGLKQDVKNLTRYIFRMVRNMAIDHARRAATELGHAAPAARLQNVASACACPQSRLEHCEALKIIQSALGELPARTRRVFELHRLHGIPQKEIVLRIGVSPTLVNFMVRDAHQHCREQLRHYEHGTAQSLVKHRAPKSDGYARASGSGVEGSPGSVSTV